MWSLGSGGSQGPLMPRPAAPRANPGSLHGGSLTLLERNGSLCPCLMVKDIKDIVPKERRAEGPADTGCAQQSSQGFPVDPAYLLDTGGLPRRCPGQESAALRSKVTYTHTHKSTLARDPRKWLNGL